MEFIDGEQIVHLEEEPTKKKIKLDKPVKLFTMANITSLFVNCIQ